MDLVQTGKFIALLRKEHGLTQERLGEILGVTNKTISRWETGTYLPPAEMLLSMSELFGVSINELLSGKRLNHTEYKAAAEENLMKTVRALNAVAERRGQSLAQLALVWALRNPVVTSALIGASKPEQVIENVKALDNMNLSGEELAEIDAILANR